MRLDEPFSFASRGVVLKVTANSFDSAESVSCFLAFLGLGDNSGSGLMSLGGLYGKLRLESIRIKESVPLLDSLSSPYPLRLFLSVSATSLMEMVSSSG